LFEFHTKQMMKGWHERVNEPLRERVWGFTRL
jgi:hypothetical protein